VQDYQHWKCDTDSDNILWLTFDRADKSANSLNREVIDEFDKILTQIENDKPVGVIIRSGKKKGFIAGADVSQFIDLKTEDEAYDLIRKGQILLDKLEALPMPTLAMISGFCLGGGTELTLACRYRIADDGDSTKMGLPEVKLGIHPGWGGTVRLPRLIGAPKAMRIILTGRALSSKKAAAIGLIDAVVPKRQLEPAARYYILNKPKPHSPSALEKFSNSALVRPWLSKLFYKTLSKKLNRQHYPAPYAVVDNWVHDEGEAKAMVREAKSIAKLMVSDTARNLVRVFFLQDRLKALAKGSKFESQRVHVIGAGTMGGDIAAWCAFKGLHVTLQDQTAEQIAPAIKRAYKLFKKKLKKPRLIQAAMDRLQPDLTGRGLRSADVVIEAIFENLEVKQKLFQDLETQIKPGALLATNTSSIPLAEIASALKEPNRLVGIHFFNPVALMPLVEVVRDTQTAKAVVDRALAFVGKIGRFPLPVASKPGFLVNRILMPYLMESMVLLEEGVPASVIDKAVLDFGMPMGPITLADKVGLDICLSVAENLSGHFGTAVPERLKAMVADGHLGVKSGRGFYRYQKGKPVIEKSNSQGASSSSSDITDRLILRMVNESVACLEEEVIDDPDLLDAGMIFGTGFAPFRGGPMHYTDTRGRTEVMKQLQTLSAKYGERFNPSAGWGGE